MTAVEDRPGAWTPPAPAPSPRRLVPLLTERELQMMVLIAGGCTNEQIGAQLYITADTVKTHVAKALRKTKTPNRAALVAWGFRTGVLS